MPYSALAVANEFLKLAGEDSAMSPMKLQKLVYFAHGWCLALTDQPLISERVEAWTYGPVIENLYHAFKNSGNGPIRELGVSTKFKDGKVMFHMPSLDDYPDDEDRRNAKQIIGQVFKVYGRYGAVQLSNATHMDGTPWQQVYKADHRSVEIPDATIKEYFRGLVQAEAPAQDAPPQVAQV